MEDDQELPSNHENSESSPRSVARRRRPPLSCTVCRRRKLKCDRAFPCSQCIKSKTPELCVYVRSQTGHVSGIPRVEDQDKLLDRTATRRSPAYSGVYVFDSKNQPSPNRVTKSKNRSDELQELRNRVQVLEHALARTGPIQTPETLGTVSSAVSDAGLRPAGDENYLSDQVRSLPWPCFRGKKTKTTYCGRSHSVVAISFFRDVGDFLKQRKSKRKEDSGYGSLKQFRREMFSKEKQDQQRARSERANSFEAFLPPRHIADELLELYLSNFETTHRVLHIPSFLKQYEEYWAGGGDPDMVFLAKLLALMAASSCFYNSSTKINGKDPLSQVVVNWIEAVQTWIVTPSATCSLDFDKLQVHCLLMIARQANAIEGDTIWISSGYLLRSAMSMGLHRNPLRFQKMSKFWAEMRRRLWATIQELDLQSSLDGGMPPSIDLEEYDCDAPSNYDDADLFESMTEDSIPKGPSVLTRSSFQVLLSYSFPIRVQIAQLVNRLRFKLSYDEALRLSEQLTQSIHEAMSLFPTERSTGNISGVRNPAFTKSYFDFIMRRNLLVLHRPFFLSIMRTPKFAYSRKVCLDSALEILSQLELPLQDLPEAKPNPHLGSLTGGMFREELFHSAMMVCVELSLQADEQRQSRSLFPGQSSVLSSLNEIVESQQTIMLHAVEAAINVFGTRIVFGGKGSKHYLFLTLVLASVKARLKGEDPYESIERSANKAIKDCRLLMRGVPWSEVRGQNENTPDLVPAPKSISKTTLLLISAPQMDDSATKLDANNESLDIPFDPSCLVSTSMSDVPVCPSHSILLTKEANL
ncbi:putative C6 transcription factor [Aspergillus clavatus NRRL 1]|uniref:Zn(2)-C6 fungal-type domain-containing protein n=1 Tax=Aspergillus clavatus (strain ATCC 1007 / CBS 513.65 / DSM 816 / NCTC 3887 / NRRL 1 / QM 1276 / 107) TaxID=344612 RepID=A1C8F3_ASPCL|nr:uncharacterized protein ACLA_043080 [Aspergillus clavatus NRRL 1]EAW13590.1 predicted protein [Aspergillus clavatus NRRL 1]